VNWAKLMFVGQGRAGKSSLLRNLTNQTHDPHQVTPDAGGDGGIGDGSAHSGQTGGGGRT
jgi:GTPase SAR1 family protein